MFLCSYLTVILAVSNQSLKKFPSQLGLDKLGLSKDKLKEIIFFFVSQISIIMNFDIILNRHLDKIKSPEIEKLVRKADD